MFLLRSEHAACGTPVAQAVGGLIYLSQLSHELCVTTMCSMSILWAITLMYGNFARRTQKASPPQC